MNIKYIKERVRLLKLSNPNMSAYEILKKRNFILGFIPTELQDELPEGCYFKHDNLRIVLVHPDLNEFEVNLVYPHELAHSDLHPDINTMYIKSYDVVFATKIELEANVYAAEFLLENDVFKKYPDLSLEDIAKKKHVSLEYVELKLKYSDKADLPEKYHNRYECNYEYEYECEHVTEYIPEYIPESVSHFDYTPYV